MRNDQQYFANTQGEELGQVLREKVENYDKYLRYSGLLDLWRRSCNLYYQSFDTEKAYIGRTGEQNEYAKMFVNQFRNIIRHLYVTTISNRPAFQPRGINRDFKTRRQIPICESMLDYYFFDLHYESMVNRATEGALLCGEWFVSQVWSKTAGEIAMIDRVPRVDEETGEPVMDPGTGEPIVDEEPLYKGDVVLRVHAPSDVIRDPALPAFRDATWLIIRDRKNRWDLAAEYPDNRAKVLAQPTMDFRNDRDTHIGPRKQRTQTMGAESDLIVYYTFYHAPTPAVPNGRLVCFLEDGTVLHETGLSAEKMEEVPVYRICAGEVTEMPFGYTVAFDLMALQDMANLMYSTTATNLSNFGVASVQAPAAAGIEASNLSGGVKLLTFQGQQGATPLELGRTPREVLEFLDRTLTGMETISSVNATVRGQPGANLESGAALALVQAQHIQFTQDFQASYGDMYARLGTGLVVLFQNHVTPQNPKQIEIIGRNNAGYIQELVGDDLSNIKRVTVDLGNYLSRTPAGRVELAKQSIEMGFIKTPEQFLTVLQTGRLDALTGGAQATLDLIQSENERLLAGEPSKVMMTDDHAQHILGHMEIFADPRVRDNDPIAANATEHIMEHYRLARETPPDLVLLLGQTPLPPVPGPAPVPEGAPAPGGGGGSAPAAPEGAGGVAAQNELPPSPGAPEFAAVNQVEMPINPATGRTWDPVTGGM